MKVDDADQLGADQTDELADQREEARGLTEEQANLMGTVVADAAGHLATALCALTQVGLPHVVLGSVVSLLNCNVHVLLGKYLGADKGATKRTLAISCSTQLDHFNEAWDSVTLLHPAADQPLN